MLPGLPCGLLRVPATGHTRGKCHSLSVAEAFMRSNGTMKPPSRSELPTVRFEVPIPDPEGVTDTIRCSGAYGAIAKLVF